MPNTAERRWIGPTVTSTRLDVTSARCVDVLADHARYALARQEYPLA
jgi:hypothetical protein